MACEPGEFQTLYLSIEQSSGTTVMSMWVQVGPGGSGDSGNLEFSWRGTEGAIRTIEVARGRPGR